MTLRFLVIPLLAATLAGCGDDPQGTLTVIDSAGVRHTVSPDTTRIFAEVEPIPLVSIGGPEVSGPAQLFRVQGIHVDREGRLWIADGGSGELRIFRPDGSHWKTRGGMGEGPGEFRRIHLLGPFRGDSVAVWDYANPRLTIYDSNGELARMVGAERGGSPPPHAIGIFSDGAILAKKPVVLPAGAIDPGQLLGDTVALVRADLATTTEALLGVAAGPLWVFTGTSQVPIPFTIHAPFLLRRDEVHLSTGSDFRIQILGDGSLAEEYGVDRDPREVTRDHVQAYVELYKEYIPDPAQRSEYLSTVDHRDRPGHLPSYDVLRVADDGKVWAQIYEPDFSGRRWDVYAPSREWVGQVEIPESFTLMAISNQRLVGVWRDDLGVEYVRVYRLRGFREE